MKKITNIGPDQGFDAYLVAGKNECIIGLPPKNRVPLAVAIRRARGLVKLLEDMKERYA